MAAWSCKALKKSFFAFLEQRPLVGKFSTFCSERMHRVTDRRVVFKFWRNLADGKLVKSCVAYLTKKNKISPDSPALAAQIAPKIRHGQRSRMYSECSRFRRNRFTFGGVIPERVNTIKRGRKVFPIFVRSLALNRIKICLYFFNSCALIQQRASLRPKSRID